MKDTIRIQKAHCRMIAHRGLSGIERQNTAAAFIAAGNRSYFGIETDIHRTADGRFAVLHDGDTESVCGQKFAVGEHTLAELQALTLFDMAGTKLRADLRIPSFEEYLSICETYHKTCVVELKDDFTEEELRQILALTTAAGRKDHSIFISFLPGNLERLRRLAPDWPAQLLTDACPPETMTFLKKHRLGLDIWLGGLTEDLAAEVKRAGITLNVWTCDDPAAAETLIGWGADYLTSNILE